MVTIIDYKVGNLGSIQNMLKKIGTSSLITSDPEEIKQATKLILPGVGAFDSGIKSLKEHNLWNVLHDKVLLERTPVLGICLGMQLLCNKSEEGKEKGLGWIDAEVIKFKPEDRSFKTPHMGWNHTKYSAESNLFKDMYADPKFYFVHSFYVKANDESSIARTTYDIQFDAAVEKGNILGTQFHPEKSHKFGMKLLENFVQHY